MARRVICITGMHRSGTSAVSRVINLLGASLGDETDLIAAMEDNPRGFWESVTLTRFAEGMLRARGGSWDDPPMLADGWHTDDRLDLARANGAGLMKPLLDSGEVVAWKDPRSSLLLPFWRTITTIDRTLLVMRDPRDVAGSLAKRNGLPTERAAYLWLRYNVAAWRGDPDRRLVSYAALLQDPDPTIAGIAEAVGVPTPEPERCSKIAAEVDADIRHNHDVRVGPIMGIALEYFQLCMAADPFEVDSAAHDLHHRWLDVASTDRRLRRARRVVRTTLPPQVRRRLRSQVGGLVSLPLRRATKTVPVTTPTPRPRPGGWRRI